MATSDGECHLVNPHFDLKLEQACADVVKDFKKKNIVLGVRPENINLVGMQEALLSAVCLVSEPQGSHQVIAIELDEKIIKIVAPASPKIHPGETVYLDFKQETFLKQQGY